MLLLLTLALQGCPAAPEGSAGTGSDERVAPPGFTLANLAGDSVSLEDQLGRVVLVDFWATWCAPCIHQIPVLNEFHEQRGNEVVIFGVAVDAEGREVVEPFAREQQIHYPVLLGSESLARDFGAFGFPTLFVIAPDGAVDSIHVGVADPEDLERAVRDARVNAPGPSS